MKKIVGCLFFIVYSLFCLAQRKDTIQSPQKITKHTIIGRYEGKEIYCRLSIKIKRDHKIKIYRRCEANKPHRTKAKWKIENDTLIVTGWFDSDPQKWILINNCLYELSEENKKLIGCKN